MFIITNTDNIPVSGYLQGNNMYRLRITNRGVTLMLSQRSTI